MHESAIQLGFSWLTRPAAPPSWLQPGTNCNRSCWKAPNLFGLKNTLFRLCNAKVR